MRTRMYGGVGGRKTKVGRKLTFVFLLPDYLKYLLKSPWNPAPCRASSLHIS